MKAIQITQYGGPDVLRYIDLPVPQPGAGQVLVRIHSAGVGKPDVLLRTGVYKWKPPLPTVLGSEGTGSIVEVGTDVEGFAAGDKVLVSYASVGSYAEYVVAPAKNVLKLPAGLDLQQAVNIPNYVTAYALLHDAARGIEWDMLYVNGAAGGLGVAIIELANNLGKKVIAGASTEEKCAFLRKQGAAHTINYGAQAVVPEVLRLTDGCGVPLILDHLIGPRFTDSLDMLAPLGMIVSFNALLGFPAEDLFAQMRAHLANSPAVRCFSGHIYDKNPARLREIQTAVLKLFASGAMKPPIYEVIPLAQAQRAHELLDAGKVLGKLILKP
jgi:NADPH2:quinone reductase